MEAEEQCHRPPRSPSEVEEDDDDAWLSDEDAIFAEGAEVVAASSTSMLSAVV